MVLLEVEQSNAPNFVTVVEAGLLAKTGMNAAGLAVAALALVSTHDKCAPGIPFHILLRALMDCETLPDAEALIHKHVRASSANYLVGHSDGSMINFETAPGDFTMVSRQLPEAGALLHSNHFLEPPGDAKDLAGLSMQDSFMRYHQISQGIGDESSLHSLGTLREVMSDHTEYPNSICCHPDPNDHPAQQWCTAASVVFDLTARKKYLAEGNPCEYEHEELEFDEAFMPR